MNKSITINGVAVATMDENEKVVCIQFLPDDELTPVLGHSSASNGLLQLLRNGAFDYTPNKSKGRANSVLLRKSAHGRLSATRDDAYQLTLKVFKREGIDVKETLAREAFELLHSVAL